MGSRGPVPGTGGRPTRRGRLSALPTLVPSRPPAVPDPPEGLAPAGLEVWERCWSAVPWLDPMQHAGPVGELARLADELVVYRAALEEHGALLDEPIVSPRGDVVGARLVANPAEQMARRAGAAMERLWAAMGLTPAARARLGLDGLTALRTAAAIRREEDR